MTRVSSMSHPGQCASKGDEGEGNVPTNAWMMQSSRISPIQRGTSRPLGKSRKNAKREVCPRKSMRLRGKERAGETSASTAGVLLFEKVVTLNIPRKKAACSANQSSDRRQKMKKPTPYQMAEVITLKMVSRAASPLTERPMVERDCCTCAGMAPDWTC